MKSKSIVVALLIVASAIVFHAWYPEYKKDQLRQEVYDFCMDTKGDDHWCRRHAIDQIK